MPNPALRTGQYSNVKLPSLGKQMKGKLQPKGKSEEWKGATLKVREEGSEEVREGGSEKGREGPPQ